MRRTLNPLGILSLAALAACGPDASNTGAIGQADTAVPAFGTPFANKIGMGYNSNVETFTTQCASSPILHIGQRSATINLDKSVSSSQIADSLGLTASLKAKYAWLTASITTDVSSSVQEDEFSELFVYRAEYNLANDSFDETNFQLTPVGKAAQQNLTWQQVCGDQFIYQMTNGARFYIVYRLEFASKTDKQNFDLTVGANISGIVDLNTTVKKIDSNIVNRTKIEVRVYQFGGDPTQLSAVIAGMGKTETDQQGNARAIVECDLAHLSSCQQILTNAIAYNDVNAPKGLPAQINANPSNPTSYLLKPWTGLALPSTPGVLTAEIEGARSLLSTKFDAIFAAKQRMEKMLTLFNLPNDQKAQLTTWKQRLDKDTLAINSAVVACYDNLKFDPAGKPLADLVQACVTAVDNIDATVPPEDLLDATGAWLIDGRATKDGLALKGNVISAGEGAYRETTLGGAIFWSTATDVHVLSAPFYAKLKQMGGPGGVLGFPVTDVWEDTVNGGQVVNLQGGIMTGRTTLACPTTALVLKRPPLCRPTIVVNEVHGAIYAKYAKLGATGSFLGYPITDETAGPSGGRFNHFDNGSIYWTANTNEAFEVHGGIRDTFNANGGVGGVLGYPRTDESPGYDGVGRFNDFQGGSIFWHPNIGAVLLSGAIAAKYNEPRVDPAVDPSTMPQPIGRYLNPVLGYPTAAVETLPDNGLLARFQRGAILWSPASGANEVVEPMFTKYWSRASLFIPPPPPRGGVPDNTVKHGVPPAGYPIEPEHVRTDPTQAVLGFFTQLQHGIATYVPGAPDAYYLDGIEYTTYANNGGVLSCLGFPISDQQPMFNAKELVRYFQHGELWVVPNDFGIPGNTTTSVKCK